MRLIASSILRISLRSRSRVRSSRLNSDSWVARSFGSGKFAASSFMCSTVRSTSCIRSRFQLLRIVRKCSSCSLLMYCSPRRGMYGFTLRGPASRFVLGASWLSRSSASLLVSLSREIGITGLAAMIARAGAAGAGFGSGFGGVALATASLAGFAFGGLAVGVALADLAAGLAALGRCAAAGLLRSTDFFAGAAFFADSVFLTTVFLAFVAFADGFFAAIERASAPCRPRGPRQVITHEGRDYTDGCTLVQPAGTAPFRV